VNAVPGDLAVAAHHLSSDVATAGLDIPSAELRALTAAAAFRHERHELAREQADRLAARLPLPQIRLPYLFSEIGPTEVDALADAFTADVRALPDPTLRDPRS
jgi:hypothetical protein